MPIEFSILMRQIMESENMNLTRFYNFLKEKGLNVTYPTLSTYRNGNSVPSFSKAKMIVSSTDYPITDEELQDILNYSKEQLHYQREEAGNYIQRSIRIKPEWYDDQITTADLQFTIRKRISDLYGEDESFNRYLNDLIKKDLIENGYIRNTASAETNEKEQK